MYGSVFAARGPKCVNVCRDCQHTWNSLRLQTTSDKLGDSKESRRGSLHKVLHSPASTGETFHKTKALLFLFPAMMYGEDYQAAVLKGLVWEVPNYQEVQLTHTSGYCVSNQYDFVNFSVERSENIKTTWQFYFPISNRSYFKAFIGLNNTQKKTVKRQLYICITQNVFKHFYISYLDVSQPFHCLKEDKMSPSELESYNAKNNPELILMATQAETKFVTWQQ